MEHLKSVARLELDGLAFDFIFTVPVVWPARARAAFEQVVAQAGFQSAGRPQDHLSIITEAEGAAYAVLQEHEGGLQDGDGLMICDLGGGTLDIASFYISQTSSGLRVTQILSEMGARCGSSVIDARLYRLLSDCFGEAFDALDVAVTGPGSPFWNELERLKRGFDASQPRYTLNLRLGPIERGNPHYDARNRSVILSREEVARIMFDPVVDKIVDTLAGHLNQASQETRGRSLINKIAIVGGFSSSPYLRERITNSGINGPGVQFLITRHPQLAVAQGALHRHLLGAFVTTPPSPYSYGVQVCRPVQDGDDPNERRVDTVTDQYMSHNVAAWVVKKGEEKRRGWAHTEQAYMAHGPQDHRVRSIHIFRCGLDTPPTPHINYNREDYRALEHVGGLQLDFRDIQLPRTFPSRVNNGTTVYQLRCDIEVTISKMPYQLKFTAFAPQRVKIGETITDITLPFQ
ncbi:hypothetical protein BJY00DRAFT_316795 [Aspergillus carlsbadensis]|nr:hypothetical protein BJY00DRAFT_316795 [Aspergillus carlsbadensis]